MNYTLVSTLLVSVSFFSTITAAQKEPKTFTPWTAEQLRTYTERSEEYAEIFGLKDNPQKEIELQIIIHQTIQKPGIMEMINFILDGNNKVK